MLVEKLGPLPETHNKRLNVFFLSPHLCVCLYSIYFNKFPVNEVAVDLWSNTIVAVSRGYDTCFTVKAYDGLLKLSVAQPVYL